MVHISDGVLAPEIWITGYIVTAVILFFTLRRVRAEDIPKISIVTSAFFIASLIHIPIGPTSAHLILNGLMGILLGLYSYPAIFIGLLLQALLFQHGGITTLGINTINMGIPALIAYYIFRLKKNPITAGVACGLAVFLAVLLTSIVLMLSGEEFYEVAVLLFIAHVPIAMVEAFVSAFVVAMLLKVKREVIA
ncbi:cobalt transporter CbiM [Archaeoglobus profundus]|uniref:Cobalamin (Vitamin B12) biosynthesis CbiM protein n=1 Tax=Archaeoglobus profundus (strain DSM 5631 / JCM 9629 / NBRC 100127 / Av18) TaxID=572546 RepID=D2RGR1_ARCPA|nr:cobalt transporter CbiM [Archaeoglobus profundus]ADB57486.1 cobalamin (vitamin B12) biosynthesis CbiM protein [Archaeoglobus profundus DSM 5631]